MYKEITIKNFKCLKDVTVKGLQPFNVLIGPNDSGKSAFLEALHYLSLTAKYPLDGKHFPPFESVLWKGEKAPDEKGIALFIKDGSFFPYVLRMSPDGTIEEARCIMNPYEMHGSDEEKEEERQHHEAEMKTRISSTVKYNLSPFAVKMSAKIEKEKVYLSQGGATLPAVLEYLLNNERKAFLKIEEKLREFRPEIRAINLETVGENADKKKLWFEVGDNNWKIDAAEMSQGVLYYLAYLTIAFGEKPPALIMIEEPENGLHPGALREVMTVLRRLTDKEKGIGSQVIITTHSPDLLDYAAPEEVFVFQKQKDGSTKITPLADRKEKLQKYLDEGVTLGELWYNIEEGGLVRE